MVHTKSILVTIVSAKTMYYEKLIISQQIISVRSNVITVDSPVQLSLWKLLIINCLIIVLIKISIRIRPNTN